MRESHEASGQELGTLKILVAQQEDTIKEQTRLLGKKREELDQARKAIALKDKQLEEQAAALSRLMDDEKRQPEEGVERDQEEDFFEASTWDQEEGEGLGEEAH